MGTAPHIAGLVQSRVNRFSMEHAPAAGKTPVWLNRAVGACQMARQPPQKRSGMSTFLLCKEDIKC
ncbi:hypothetical protein C1X72_04320 [Pseudomonas sp. FW306-2-2C-D06B]|nr:hypothetical protein C1X72_04320 [Pseudomonas sp. FW306-2-2C-D06B]PYG96722.1 hypothetical protein CVV67_31630 [Arthrobacter stackebrandtii]